MPGIGEGKVLDAGGSGRRLRRRRPLHPNVRRSPYFRATEEAGAVEYMVYNHMYMPIDYGRDPEDDYRALVERVTLWDVGAERQTQIRGRDALEFADFLAPRNLRGLEVGRCLYSPVCDESGVVMAECVILHPFEDAVWFSHGDVDLTLWAKGIALGRGLDLDIGEPDVSPLQIQGPRSRTVLESLVGAATAELRPFRCAAAEIAGIPLVVSRTGWSGELGYELYPLSSERALDLWNVIVDAGAEHGMLITGPNLVRACERGITDTHYFVSSGMNPFEAGMGWSVDLEGPPFVGREALREIAGRPLRRRTMGLVGRPPPMPRLESFWSVVGNEGIVGEVRWAVHSIALGRPIAIALMDARIDDGETVTILHPDGEATATVTALPFVPGPGPEEQVG